MDGEVLGPYRIVRELGIGGMGTVYLAEVLEPTAGLIAGARVALKVVHPHLLETPGFFKRFLREAEIGRRVRHPNVVSTHDADAIDVGGRTYHFLVTEYVEGQTLRALLDELDHAPEELTRHIGREMARALEAVHREGAVHRDIKPENVLITAGESVKLMDLGVARLKDESIRLSQTGQFLGSVQYAAPEQFEAAEDVDGRADLYALGLLLVELATGRSPFGGGTYHEVMRMRALAEHRPGADLAPHMSAFLEEVTRTLLEREPADRFESASALLAVLTDGERSEWWRNRAAKPRPTAPGRPRVARETDVVGRETELLTLRALFSKVRKGEGQVVLVEGEAGIGKTRLVDEAVARLLERGEDVTFLFGSYPPGGAATAAAAFAAALSNHFGTERLGQAIGRHLRGTPALATAFTSFLRGTPTATGAEGLGRESVHTAFVEIVRDLASRRPVVMLVDDLHLAPEEGRALFAALVPPAASQRLLLIGTARHWPDPEWIAGLTRLRHVSRLHLARLPRDDLERLLADVFRSERMPRDLVDSILKRSDGNPYFVLEILRDLREQGLLEVGEDGRVTPSRRIRDIRIPSTVNDLLHARIAGLSEEERELLEVAACSGFEFDPILVAEAQGRDLMPVLKAFRRIERSHRLIRAAGRTYVFDHRQLRDVLYGGVFELMRENVHASIGEALERRHEPAGDPGGPEAVEVCRHFLHGGAGERALPHLDAALEHLERAHLSEEALGLIDRALATSDLLPPDRRAKLLLDQAEILDLRGRREEEGAAIEEALAIARMEQDPPLLARALVAFGAHLLKRSRHEEALERLEEARRAAEESGEDRLIGTALEAIGMVHQAAGRYAEAEAALTSRLELARKAEDGAAEGRARGKLGNVAFFLGRHEEAEAHYEAWREIAKRSGRRREEGTAVGNLGALYGQMGRLDEARPLVERRLEIACEIGDRRGEASATGNLGNLELMAGRYAEARRSYGAWARMASEIGERQDEGNAHLNLGLVLLSLGEPEQAEAALQAGLALVREIGAKRAEGYALHGLGRAAAFRGDQEESLRWYREALAVRRETPFPLGVAETLVALADVELAAGATGDAARHTEEAAGLAEELGGAGLVLQAACVAARLPDGDVSRAVSAYERHSEALGHEERMEAQYLLYRLTGEEPRLDDARRMLDELLARLPEEHRAIAVSGVPLHRRIRAEGADSDTVP